MGNLLIISAPSGAGKTSLIKALLTRLPGLVMSVSHTTRPKRSGETEAVDYYYVSPDQFNAMAEQGEFLEHATVFGNQYGTSKASLVKQLHAGVDVLLEIDWQGAQQIREKLPQAAWVFVLPPSRHALLSRLNQRGQDSPEVITRRMQAAINEMSHYAEADYLVINDEFGVAIQELATITQSLRLRCDSQEKRHTALIDELLASD